MGVLKMQQAEAVGVLSSADTSKAEVGSQQRIPLATKTVGRDTRAWPNLLSVHTWRRGCKCKAEGTDQRFADALSDSKKQESEIDFQLLSQRIHVAA